jgi:hypothetical protein
VDYYLAHNVTPAPSCYVWHVTKRQPCPLDWKHTLAAIYQVRNNLFHGEKAGHSTVDKAIVSAAANTLMPFLSHLLGAS